MHGISVMALQATSRAGEARLVWLEEGTKQRKNNVTPKIIMATEISRPDHPRSVMPPKPVVVRAVTVK